MTTHNKTANLSCAERLNTVLRLRLLRNTTGELSAHTGIELRNNSFSKKATFITKCIHSEFSRETELRTGLTLDDLLAAYRTASRYYDKIANTRKAQPEFHLRVLRVLLDEQFAASSDSKPYRAAAEAAEKTDAALLTLLILKIIPSYESKSGDVDANSFYEHLSRLREYFSLLYDDSRVMRFAPYLTELYQKSVRRIRNGELFTRLELINFTQEIIANLRNNYDPEHLLRANLYYNQHKIHPPLDGCVWVEPDYCSPQPVYWTFESVGSDYIVSRKQYDAERKHITETRYELFLFRSGQTATFMLMRQSAAAYLCRGESIPEAAYMHGYCTIDDADNPTSINFDFTGNRYDDFPTALTRADDSAHRIAALVDDSWSAECETGEWEYLPVERVITQRYIYVECDSEPTTDGGRRVISWYCVPRTGLLTEVGISTTIVRVRHDGKLHLGFVPQNCFFDVTDAASIEQAGIAIQENISVEYQ